jgi:CRP-like cAMP-binding protein
VKARTDVVALAVTGADFRRFLGTAPGAAVVVLDTVIERLEVADAQRRDLAALDVVARVAARLLELGERFGVGGEVVVTHEELAALAGASPRTFGAWLATPACGGASRFISCATPTPSRWRARACR